MFHLPDKIPYSSGNRNDGFKYEDKVILYVAASLSHDQNVKDFWLVSNPTGIDSFDDVVLGVLLKNGEKIMIFTQIKLTHNTLLLKPKKIKGKQINMSQYKRHAEKIMEIRNCKENIFYEELKDIELDKYFFCIFSNSPATFPELVTKQLNEYVKFMDASGNNKCLQFDCTSEEFNHQFYKQLFIFLGQPNVVNIDTTLQNILGECFIPRRIEELSKQIQNYMINGNTTKPLMKKSFDMMCLEVLLDEWILTDIPLIEDINRKYIMMWMGIFSTEQVINFHNIGKVRSLLGYIFQETIRQNIDETFSWSDGITDNIKAAVEKKYGKTVNEIKGLIYLMWQEEQLLLPIKPESTKEFLSVLNNYLNLKKRFIIFSEADVSFQDGTEIINHVRQLSNPFTFLCMLLVNVSLQGRPPLTLHEIAMTSDSNREQHQKILDNITMEQLLCWTAATPESNQHQHIIGQQLKQPDNNYILRDQEI